MQIDWRLVVFELLNFAVLMALLGRFLFRPVRETLARRRAELEAHDRDLAAQRAAAAAVQADYGAKLAGLREEGERLRAEVHRRAEGEAEELIEAARRDMRLARERQRAEMEQAQRRSIDAVSEQIAELAAEGAARVVAGMGESGVAEAYARLAAQRLQAAATVPAGATVRLWVSPDADADAVRRVAAGVLGAGPELLCEVDPALVGGVRLEWRDLQVESSAGASLQQWLAGVTGEPEFAAEGGDA